MYGMEYFVGNPFNSEKIFTLEKKITKIMVGAKASILCGILFKNYTFHLFHANMYFH
jgi:hypothetical protein